MHTDAIRERQQWMSVLARAEPGELETACAGLGSLPAFDWLRAPETGLVMVQARAGGSGARFNLGEVSVTRCALRFATGTIGFAYVRGRSHRHAELAALLDALLQESRRSEVHRAVIAPLAQAQSERHDVAARKAAATRVEFFTLVRGEDDR
jgi:alpha-D-ribose 1-methylphosphonate 5-triphosphate synthase subunit PhnG